MRKKKSNIYKTNLSLLAVVVMAVITLASVFVYRRLINDTFQIDATGNKFYTYHFAMVAEPSEDPFWKQRMARGKRGGRKHGCLCGVDRKFAYKKISFVGSDGDGDCRASGRNPRATGRLDEMTQLIQQAIEDGIPVITVMSDSAGSKRQGFVGYNSYDLGQLYGQQVRTAISQSHDASRAVLLYSNDLTENTQNIIYSSLMESLEDKTSP